MAQAFVDYFPSEVIGQMSSMQNCLIDHIVCETLGYFKFGTIDIDLISMQVLGAAPGTCYVSHLSAEVCGQWAGF